MIVLDWRKNTAGPPRACRICGKPAICRDEVGKPAHKVCVELEIERKGAR